jgi:hypothetical protein
MIELPFTAVMVTLFLYAELHRYDGFIGASMAVIDHCLTPNYGFSYGSEEAEKYVMWVQWVNV